jgi:hypothetical protein
LKGFSSTFRRRVLWSSSSSRCSSNGNEAIMRIDVDVVVKEISVPSVAP